MKLRVKILGLSAGDRPIAVLHNDTAKDLGIRSLDRIVVKHEDKKITAIVNTTEKTVKKKEIGVFDKIIEEIGIAEGDRVNVNVSNFPSSIKHIKSKLDGRKLNDDQLLKIVEDVVNNKLSEIEISSFVTSLHKNPLDIDEIVGLSKAMVKTGKSMEIKNSYIVDKHSIGGVPGDKTSLLVVPIIAACGLTIPKTSSRAITSPAGTADRAEVLMPVDLGIEEMKIVVKKTGGCIVWGGSLDMAPADDIFIKIEYPLSIDPLMMPSIMSKKKAVNAEYLIIDIPCGRGTKIKTIGDADILAKDFIEIGKKLGIRTECAITYGEQPIGYNIGSGLEAREALEVIMKKRKSPDLLDKAKRISSTLLDMTGKNGGKIVDKVWSSDKVEKKFREIIFEQGGNPDIVPEDIEIGKYGLDVNADTNGTVQWINNHHLVSIARAAGTPKDIGAGIELYKKIGDKVEKGEKIFTIYSEKARKLKRARKQLEKDDVFGIGNRRDMLIHTIKKNPIDKKSFILER